MNWDNRDVLASGVVLVMRTIWWQAWHPGTVHGEFFPDGHPGV